MEIYLLQDFEIDEEAPEYLALHPVAPTTNKNPSLLVEHFDPLSEEDELSVSGSESEEDTNTKFKKKSQGPR